MKSANDTVVCSLRHSAACSAMVAFAVVLSLTAFAEVKHRALLSNTNWDRNQNQILLFDVSPTSWEYVRTVVHPFDGHCRIPGAAVYVDGIVYVTDWAGKKK